MKNLFLFLAVSGLLVLGFMFHRSSTWAAGKPVVEGHEAFSKIKSLAGTWVLVGADGEATEAVISIYRVTAGGSAVIETIFPGQAEEMISMYYLDAGKLVLDHYCMMQNQPHFELQAESTADKLVFLSTRGGNLKDLKSAHMRKGTAKIIDKDNLETEWLGMADEKVIHTAAFKLRRRAESGK